MGERGVHRLGQRHIDAPQDLQGAGAAALQHGDLVAVTRNAEGQVIAGSLNDAVDTCDLWTFSRSTKSDSPDWLVDETDED